MAADIDPRLRNEFFSALRQRQIADALRRLQKHPQLARECDSEGQTALHRAAAGDNEELVQKLLELGASQAQRDGRGWTPLHVACNSSSSRFLHVLGRLLDGGAAPVRAKTDSSNSVLNMLAVNTSWTCAEPDQTELYKGMFDRLVELGADPNSRNEQDITPLHEAVGRMNLVAIDALLRHGAKINAKTRDGKTPLHWAVMIGDARIVKRLLNYNADIHAEDTDNQSPLDHGLRSPNPEIVEIFQNPNLPAKPMPRAPSPPVSTPAPAAPKEDLYCKICMENKISMVIVPCGHSVLCDGCAEDIKQKSNRCPICRNEIQSTMRFFLS